MALEYIPLYYSYRKKLEKLSDQEVGRLVRSLLEYGETGETKELAGRESIAFDFIADDINRAKAAYDERCTKNQRNIEKRYARQDDTTVYDGIRTNTTVYETYQTKTKTKDKTKDKEEKENSKEKAAAAAAPKAQTNTKFLQPTVEEIRDYCRTRGNCVDAERFYDYYASNGWKVGKNPMKDWKAAVRTWERTWEERNDRDHGDAGHAEHRDFSGIGTDL